ncbi:MAG: hypothetical protein EXS05_07000 [Planctomycetaceae bacterium]|nr:hypothetical protein [Planctomycetaceae bacterium]
MGRFISEDPMGFAAGDVNLSRYVGNAPTNFVDPSGMEVESTADSDSMYSPDYQQWIVSLKDGESAFHDESGWQAFKDALKKGMKEVGFGGGMEIINQIKGPDLITLGGDLLKKMSDWNYYMIHPDKIKPMKIDFTTLMADLGRQMRSNATAGFYDPVIEYWTTGDPTAFQQHSGAFLVDTLAMYFMGKLPEWFGPKCFVPGTVVLVPETDVPAMTMNTDPAEASDNDRWSLAIAGVAASLAVMQREAERRSRRRRGKRGKSHYDSDDSAAFNELFDDEPEPAAATPLDSLVPQLLENVRGMEATQEATEPIDQTAITPDAAAANAGINDRRQLMVLTDESVSRSPYTASLSTRVPQRQFNRRAAWSTFKIAACLVIAAVFAVNGLRSDPAHSQVAAAAVPAARQQGLKPIETVRVGERVLTGRDGVSAGETEVDPTTWRRLRLRSETRWEDGSLDVVDVETLQPREWVQQNGAWVGAVVPLPLDLPEIDEAENLLGTVIGNDPCPTLKSGPGRIVLTTVSHLNPEVVELTLQDEFGRSELVRATGIHRFYSEDRHDWIASRDLYHGEQVRGYSGPLTVADRTAVPGIHRVYNLTVEGDHVYHVSRLGALAHNDSCSSGGPKPSPKFQPPTNPAQVPPADIPAGVRLFRGAPTQQYPNGYWKLEKWDGQGWQRLDPRTMKPGPHPDTHVEFPDGDTGPFDN